MKTVFFCQNICYIVQSMRFPVEGTVYLLVGILLPEKVSQNSLNPGHSVSFLVVRLFFCVEVN